MKTGKETWLNQGTEKLTADELTMMADDKDIMDARSEKSVWLLITIDDKQVIGEKPVVFAYTSEDSAVDAMRRDIQQEADSGRISLVDIEYSSEKDYAQTSNRRFSWEVVKTRLREV